MEMMLSSRLRRELFAFLLFFSSLFDFRFFFWRTIAKSALRGPIAKATSLRLSVTVVGKLTLPLILISLFRLISETGSLLMLITILFRCRLASGSARDVWAWILPVLLLAY